MSYAATKSRCAVKRAALQLFRRKSGAVARVEWELLLDCGHVTRRDAVVTGFTSYNPSTTGGDSTVRLSVKPHATAYKCGSCSWGVKL